MRSRQTIFLIFALIVAITPSPLPGQDNKPPAQPSVEQLVTDLGHPVFSVREKAQAELWKRGDAAIPLLEKSLADENPEVVQRARELLNKFAWGIRPDTPAAVVKILRQYQNGDVNEEKASETRKAAVQDLLQHGSAGISVVKALLQKSLPEAVKSELVEQVTAYVRQNVPLRLFDRQENEAAELIGLCATGLTTATTADYTVFQLLSGKVPQAISQAENALSLKRQELGHKLVLSHLYRAKGDWAKARATSADLPRPDEAPNVAAQLLEEAGDWGALIEVGYGSELNHPDALRLSLLRLAGRTKALDAQVRNLIKSTNEFSSTEEVWESVIALLANHRAEEATKILLERRQHLGLLGEVMIQRLQYKDALELTVAEKELRPNEKLDLDLRRARILMHIGRRSDAVQLFNSVYEGMRVRAKDRESSSPIVSIRSLLRAEMRVGLKDLAAEHAANFIAMGVFQRSANAPTGETAFEILFDQDAIAADTLFTALRQKKIPGDEAGRTMSHVRDLLGGKANKLAVDAAIVAVRESRSEIEVESTDPGVHRSASKSFESQQQLTIATLCRAAKRYPEAEAAYEKSAELSVETGDVSVGRAWAYGTSEAYLPYVEWGNLLVEQGQFRDAAKRYLQGWRKFPSQPLPLFLSGKALVQAGEREEGERRIELSHWVSLGQERIRGRFLEDLVRAGEGKAAKRETELLLHGCWCQDYHFGNVMNQAAKASAMINDFTTAELCTQRSLLMMLKTPNMYYVESVAYMSVPHDLLINRAKAALAAGQVGDAMTIARQVLAITPGHVTLVSGMVPALEKLGKKTEANELFGTVWKAYEAMLASYPDSPAARNSLALLAANCQRDLEAGLRYATEAVKAFPESVPYRETLAEILFRKGERDKALELMTKLIEEEPRKRLYRRQLVRYRSGPLDGPKPDTED